MLMRKTRRYKNKRKKKIIIISTLCLLFFMVAGYAAFETNLNITAKGNIADRSRVIQSWTATSQEDFHSDYYRENIVSATFLDNARVPSNAAQSWDVSEAKDKGVMAYVVPNNEDNTKYDLYIGANGGVIANENNSYLFSNFRALSLIEFGENFDTVLAIDMTGMFLNCTSLEELDLSNFDTRNVTSMYAMFGVYDNNSGFLDNKLVSIKFGDNFKTNNVTNMRSMFTGLSKLETLDVSGFDTSKVTSMFHMFMRCENLKTLNLSSFNTSNVTDMNQMFAYCKNLTELNLCTFDTSKVTDMKWMFQQAPKLTKIYVGPNWTTANADITQMFYGSSVSSVTTGQC